MTIDTRDVNNIGTAEFRTQANNKRGKSFNSFPTVKKQTSQANEIIFFIVNVIDKTNKNSNIFFGINVELSGVKNDNVQYKQPIQRLSESDIFRTTDRKQQQQQHTRRSDGQVTKKPRILSG